MHSLITSLLLLLFFFFYKDYVAGWDCEKRKEVGDVADGCGERDFEELGCQRVDFAGEWGSLGYDKALGGRL